MFGKHCSNQQKLNISLLFGKDKLYNVCLNIIIADSEIILIILVY